MNVILNLHCNFKSCETNVANDKAVNFRAFIVEVSIRNFFLVNLLQVIAIEVLKTLQIVDLNTLTTVNKESSEISQQNS